MGPFLRAGCDRWRSRCSRCAGDWCEADRSAERLDVAQGRHSQGRRDPHRQGRHRRHCRVLRARHRLHLLHRSVVVLVCRSIRA